MRISQKWMLTPLTVILLLCPFTCDLGSQPQLSSHRVSVIGEGCNNNILYVGGTGPGNYSTIQEAIDDATAGDTVYICSHSSPYTERILIHTSIILEGEDRSSTIIWGSGRTVHVAAKDVIIRHLTVVGGSYGLWIEAPDTTVIEVTVRDCIDGIWIQTAERATIAAAKVFNCTYDGIVAYRASNTSIVNNEVKGSGYDGIVLYHGGHNVVEANDVHHHRYYGIAVDNEAYSEVTANTIWDNQYCGLVLNASHHIAIHHNNFLRNPRHARFLQNQLFTANSWNQNYWDDWPLVLPRPISGTLSGIPWLRFDWQPLREPSQYPPLG